MRREQRGHHSGVNELAANFLAVLDRGAKHNRLAVWRELAPFGHNVADDLHAALLCGSVGPFAARSLCAGHVWLGATENPHRNQHARFGQLTHRCRVYQIGKNPPEPGAERCRGKSDNSRVAILNVLRPCTVLRMRFVDHDHIALRPVAARKRLDAGNLKRQTTILAPMVGLDHAVRAKPVGIRNRTCLLNQRGTVAYKHRTLAAKQRLVNHAHAEIRLTGSGRCHDELRPVACPCAFAQTLMRVILERARRREGGVRVVRGKQSVKAHSSRPLICAQAIGSLACFLRLQVLQSS